MAASAYTPVYGLRMSKWKAGVRSLRALPHFGPFAINSPSPAEMDESYIHFCLCSTLVHCIAYQAMAKEQSISYQTWDLQWQGDQYQYNINSASPNYNYTLPYSGKIWRAIRYLTMRVISHAAVLMAAKFQSIIGHSLYNLNMHGSHYIRNIFSMLSVLLHGAHRQIAYFHSCDHYKRLKN